MTKRATIVAVFSTLVLGVALRAQDYQVIAHASNPVSSMSKEELSRIFLGKTKVWDNGKKVEVVDQVSGSLVRQRFSQEVLSKKTAAVVSHWQDQLFSGRAKPPAQLRSNAEVVDYVRSHPNAIGYVSSSTPLGAGVKVVTISH